MPVQLPLIWAVYFLSDNASNPDKWEIPAGTTIPLAVFCDSGVRGVMVSGSNYPVSFKITQTVVDEDVVFTALMV